MAILHQARLRALIRLQSRETRVQNQDDTMVATYKDAAVSIMDGHSNLEKIPSRDGLDSSLSLSLSLSLPPLLIQPFSTERPNGVVA